MDKRRKERLIAKRDREFEYKSHNRSRLCFCDKCLSFSRETSYPKDENGYLFLDKDTSLIRVDLHGLAKYISDFVTNEETSFEVVGYHAKRIFSSSTIQAIKHSYRIADDVTNEQFFINALAVELLAQMGLLINSVNPTTHGYVISLFDRLGKPNITGANIFGYIPEEDLVAYSNHMEQAKVVERRKMSHSLRFEILRRDSFRCRACGASPREDESVKLHVDHIIPIAKGGKTIERNLHTLCSRCNSGKRDKIVPQMEQWIATHPTDAPAPQSENGAK